MLPLKSNNKGQIVLIILLVMAVGLTIGLSVAGRSLTDVRLSSQIEESNRAFSAAEAGIEQVLKTGVASVTGTPSGTVGNASYNVNLNVIGGTTAQFSFPSTISEGDAQTIWLVGRNASGLPDDTNRDYVPSTIQFCWSYLGTSPRPAVDISVFFKNAGVYKVSRAAYDPDSTRLAQNGFSSVTDVAGGYCAAGGQTYSYRVTLNFTTLTPPISAGIAFIPIALRIKPVYNDTKIAVVPAGGAGGALPEQGKNIISTGTTASGVARRWNVVNTYASPFDIFDYGVWSGSHLQK